MTVPADQSTARAFERYRDGGYRKVPGWLNRGGCEGLIAADAAQRALAVEGHIGEIGIDGGRSLFLLCHLARPGETVVGIDPFVTRVRMPGETHEQRVTTFERQRALHLPPGCDLCVLKANSLDLAAEDLLGAAGGPFRLVHIDGSHKAEYVRHDLEVAGGALGPRGIIVLDDILAEPHPGVVSALVAYQAEHPEAALAPFALGGGKAYLAHASCAEAYRERFAALRAPLVDTASFLGHDVVLFAYEKLDDIMPAWLWRRLRGLPGVRQFRREAWRRFGYPPTKLI
ncbi:MAG: class I SAM-dependent methyltransferase [Tepidiformaceae bacterium]